MSVERGWYGWYRVGKSWKIQSVPYRGAGRAEGRGIAARRAQGRGREAAEPPTHSIADGTAEIASGERR